MTHAFRGRGKRRIPGEKTLCLTLNYLFLGQQQEGHLHLGHQHEGHLPWAAAAAGGGWPALAVVPVDGQDGAPPPAVVDGRDGPAAEVVVDRWASTTVDGPPVGVDGRDLQKKTLALQTENKHKKDSQRL